METTRTHIYPTWHWLWSTWARRIIQIIGFMTLIVTFYGLLQNKWLLSLVLTPIVIPLLLLGSDKNFKRGNVPRAILKHMLRDYSGQLHTSEAYRVVSRVYERSAAISVLEPKDVWLTRFYVGLAFAELAKSEQNSPEAYNELRDYIFNKYYPA